MVLAAPAHQGTASGPRGRRSHWWHPAAALCALLAALARVRPVYSAWARWPIWILSASLALRGAALASGSAAMMAAAGAGHALAIAWFAAAMITGIARGRKWPAARR